VEVDFAPLRLDDQVAVGVDLQGRPSVDGRARGRGKPRPYDLKSDRARVGAGSDHEVVLQLALVSVVDQIHARIDALVFHLGIVRDIGAPLLGIIAKEVVAPAGQLVEGGDPGLQVCSDQFQPQECGTVGGLLRVVGCRKQLTREQRQWTLADS